MSIGSRIAEARKQRKLTQVELAQLLGVSKGAVANYENEFCTPKTEMMYKLFEVLQVDANYLYQDDMASPPAGVLLSPDEAHIVSVYRSLPPEGRAQLQTQLLLVSNTFTSEKNKSVSAQDALK